MGTIIIWRSSDFNFEYSIVPNHSLPEDGQTLFPVVLAGRAEIAAV